LKDQVVLIDFWIKNCGPCIESVPHLVELQNKFRNSHFKLISINAYDSKEDVSWFCKKHNANYPVLLNGKPVAAQYGVGAFPAFFIIDKTRKIIYANTGFSESAQSEIERIAAAAL
ncbi:MAG TPA: TlpA disulfide reductase family protein, partial [Puia sp.]|nr:TlpA disulfide reductase family protein [Puia sp.]